MRNINKYSSRRLSDHIIMCDICGAPCWFSESKKLTTYTGRGGLRVCAKDADPIDYGLVPYKIPAEKAPREVRTNSYMNATGIEDTAAPITNYQTQNPMVISPIVTWEDLLDDTWDNWYTPWGT